MRTPTPDVEQAEARQRRDRLAPLDEPRQRQPKPQQLGVVRANSTHGEKADFHGAPDLYEGDGRVM